MKLRNGDKRMISNNGKSCSFLDVYKSTGIFIPKIQRDYVQGRKTIQVEKNRNNLIEDLCDKLTNGGQMMLNFVYGYQENGYFVPIDGQQRLTTLFLLHLYLYAKFDKLNEFVEDGKFKYDTRESTNRFLSALSNNIFEFVNSLKKDDNLVKKIEDSAWFSYSWKADPSIISCITMLDTIHSKFNSADEEVLDRLSNITFMLLDISNDIGKANQLYIRMNARGKQLTAFENFKAEMYGYLENNDCKEDIKKEKEDIKKELVANMDGKWLDFIWGLDKEYAEKYSDIFYKELLHWIIINNYIAERKDIESLEGKNQDIEQIYFTDYIREKICDALNDVCYTLNVLFAAKELDFVKNLCKYIVDGKYSTSISSYPGRARLYAITKFGQVIKDSQEVDLNKFMAWYRVINNLIRNAEIDSIDDLKKVIGGINGIDNRYVNDLKNIKSIAENLKAISNNKDYISKEEIFKQEIINNDTNGEWRKFILSAEKNEYFNGEIRFIFKAFDINDATNPCLQKIKAVETAWKKIAGLTGNCELLRLLLNEMVEKDIDKCFYTDNRFYVDVEKHHNYDTRALLRKGEGINALKEIIKNAPSIQNPRTIVVNGSDIKKIFVKNLIRNPKLIEYCKNGLFYCVDNKIYLIKGTYHQNMPEYLSYLLSLDSTKGITLNLLPNTWSVSEHTYDYKCDDQKYKTEYDKLQSKYKFIEV